MVFFSFTGKHKNNYVIQIYGITFKGAFNNYVDRTLPFSDPPPSLRGRFLYPERGQKQTFFDPLPAAHLVHVVIECPLISPFTYLRSLCLY